MLGISCRLTHYVSGVLIWVKKDLYIQNSQQTVRLVRNLKWFWSILVYIIYTVLIMAKVVFNIHNILSFTFTVQYKLVYLLLLCMYMYQSLHVMLQDWLCSASCILISPPISDYALRVVFWYHPLYQFGPLRH